MAISQVEANMASEESMRNDSFANYMPRAELDKRGYQWVEREIEKLDPHTHYEQIWSLTTIYYYGDFIMNVLYTLGMPAFTMRPKINNMLSVNTGKVLNDQQKRITDTNSRFWQWFELGPSHPDVRRSMEGVNKIHMALNKKFPGNYPASDFIYTCVWIATALHRIKISVGARGFSEKQKIAAHLYWQSLCGQFRSQEGQIEEFPDSWDDMMRLADEFEGHPWKQSESGRQLAEAITQQFNDAWLPRGLHWAGRQFVLSMQTPQTRKVMQMANPNPVMSAVIRKAVWFVFTMKERVLPTSKLSTPEKARAKRVRSPSHEQPPLAKISECPFNPNTTKKFERSDAYWEDGNLGPTVN